MGAINSPYIIIIDISFNIIYKKCWSSEVVTIGLYFIIYKPGIVMCNLNNNQYVIQYDARNINNLSDLTESLRHNLINILKNKLIKHSIKLNLKLESTYNRSH